MDEKLADLKGAGPHVGSRRLIAYRQGTLPAAERESVQEHLSLCKRCSGLLLELRDFEAASAGGTAGPESPRQEAWESLARKLPSKTPAVRPFPAAGRDARTARTARYAGDTVRRRVPLPAYGLAAALLLAVAGLSLWAAVTARQERQRLTGLEELQEEKAATAAVRRSLEETERQLAAARGQIQDLGKERGQPDGQAEELRARVAELTSELEKLRQTTRIAAAPREIELSTAPRFALRGQNAVELLRGGGASNPVRLEADHFTAALSLADHPTYGEYRLELLDRDGKVLWTGRRPGRAMLGDAGTSVSVSGLGPGLYRLRIEGLDPERTELLGEYLLEVEPL